MSILDKKFVLNFENESGLTENYSIIGQDLFVITALNGVKSKTFIEIGGDSLVDGSNTYFLEKNFGWTGIIFDKDKNKFISKTVDRKVIAYVADCTIFDFKNVLVKPKGNIVNYLSINLKNEEEINKTVNNIPFDIVSFATMTINYSSKKETKQRKASRNTLEKKGYKLLCSNVLSESEENSDWYYHPELIDEERLKVYKSKNKNWKEILFTSEARDIKQKEKVDLGEIIL